MTDSYIEESIFGALAVVTLELDAVEAIASWIPDGDTAKGEWQRLAERLRADIEASE